MNNLLGHFGNYSLGGGKLAVCSWTLTTKVESHYTRKGESLSLDTAHCKVHTYLSLLPDGVGVRTNRAYGHAPDSPLQ